MRTQTGVMQGTQIAWGEKMCTDFKMTPVMQQREEQNNQSRFEGNYKTPKKLQG